MNLKKRSIYFYPILATIVVRLAVIPFLDMSANALMEYGIIARNMLSGFGYAFTWLHSNGSAVILPTAYMPPGQVYIDYFFLGIFGDSHAGMMAIYFFQIAQACGFIWLTGKITEFLFQSEKITRLTIWIAVFYPTFIYATISFGVTSSALFLNALAFYAALRFSLSLQTGRESMKRGLLFGLSCGLLLLTRGESPLIVFSTLVLIGYQNRSTIRRSLLPLTVATLVAIGILLPWTIRNYLLFDRIIPISTNGGLNFWRGNNPASSGSPYTENGGLLWTSDKIWEELEPYLDQKGDYDKISSDIHTREALTWIRENPMAFVMLSLKKGLMLWTFDLRSKLGGTFAYIALYTCTLLALVNGIYFIRRNKIMTKNDAAGTGLQLMLLWCINVTLVGMFILPLQRFQVLLVGMYLPVIGYGIREIIEHQKQKNLRKETAHSVV